MPLDQRLRLHSRSFGKGEDLVTIIAGLHGDELDGLYLSYRLIRYLALLPADRFGGRVHFLPAANPIGLDVSSRMWPASRVDINRSFPGRIDGQPAQRIADAVFRLASRSKFCIDIHSSNLFLQEIPQVRLSQEHFHLSKPLTPYLGTEVVWVNPSPTVIEATLAWNLSAMGIPTYVIETGIGLRIMLDDCERLFHGIVAFLYATGVLVGVAQSSPIAARLAEADNVVFMNADAAGIFIPKIRIGSDVLAGTVIGTIIDPISGDAKAEVTTPSAGYLFTLRSHPLVYPGSLIARVIRPEPDGQVRRI